MSPVGRLVFNTSEAPLVCLVGSTPTSSATLPSMQTALKLQSRTRDDAMTQIDPTSATAGKADYVLVLKQDCPTCALIEPVVGELEAAGFNLTIYCQDSTDFPRCDTPVADDRQLEQSWRLGIEIVPTVIKLSGNQELERSEGWDPAIWQ